VRGRAGTLPARDARGRFTRRRGSARSADSAASGDSGRSRRSSGVGREIGSATDLVSSQQSLAWDNFTPPIQQEDDLIFDYETSSTSGLASDTLQERELEQFIEEPDRLTPVDERSKSRASTGEHERTMAGENAAVGPGDDVVAVRIPTKIMQKVPDPLLCLDFLLRPFFLCLRTAAEKNSFEDQVLQAAHGH